MLGVFDALRRPSRRELLCAGALGACGLSLPQLLQAEERRRGSSIKSCVFIFAWGGPAQQETFDMKPNAPAEVRGVFRPIATSVPGIQICEHLPRLSRLAQHFSLVRSACHSNRVHNPGAYFALTGRRPSADVVDFPARRTDFPSVGSLVARLQPVDRPVPPYVVLPIFANDVGFPTPGQHAGFLGSAVDPLVISTDPSRADFSVPALAPRAEVAESRLDQRRGLLGQVNAAAGSWSRAGAGVGLDRHYERAYDLVGSALSKQAFDLTREPAQVRDRYGRTRHGQSVLLARRLVEAGVRLVLVNDAEDNGQNKRWDTHGDGYRTLRKIMPETDAALSSLLQDLHDRGLLESTLVVWMGEFGRSPRIDAGGGRDHWPDVYSVFLAGGGIQGGRVHGSSDTRAAYPRDNPVGPEDVHATIYHALGLPQDAIIHDQFARPLALYHGRPIMPLF